MNLNLVDLCHWLWALCNKSEEPCKVRAQFGSAFPKNNKTSERSERGAVNTGHQQSPNVSQEMHARVAQIARVVNNCAVITFVPGGGDW